MAARLGAVCRDYRRRAGWSMLDIATEAGVDEATISTFERSTGAWKWRTDEIVAAYAKMLDCPPEEIWRDAIARDDPA